MRSQTLRGVTSKGRVTPYVPANSDNIERAPAPKRMSVGNLNCAISLISCSPDRFDRLSQDLHMLSAPARRIKSRIRVGCRVKPQSSWTVNWPPSGNFATTLLPARSLRRAQIPFQHKHAWSLDLHGYPMKVLAYRYSIYYRVSQGAGLSVSRERPRHRWANAG